ncbi:hypothetical protein BU14_0147s0020 [Porphyra umbilicalis]|uniref:Uncharacterized protein n=1 Tax=Porphyra umbilicalis TaxID=2786 RepID=A0A1X6P9U2_PORUM|nr:hypothetical protein BU14_0147s0020 [Porphyra umbilicalis]|eukprot:OSX77495.1 hypothetical protein BU14_0147s0020 [Porphyra umbilicalis]
MQIFQARGLSRTVRRRRRRRAVAVAHVWPPRRAARRGRRRCGRHGRRRVPPRPLGRRRPSVGVRGPRAGGRRRCPRCWHTHRRRAAPAPPSTPTRDAPSAVGGGGGYGGHAERWAGSHPLVAHPCHLPTAAGRARQEAADRRLARPLAPIGAAADHAARRSRGVLDGFSVGRGRARCPRARKGSV